MNRFWMVYVDGGNSPAVCHDTEDKAKMEAGKLAVKTGRSAYVLVSIGRYGAVVQFEPAE